MRREWIGTDLEELGRLLGASKWVAFSTTDEDQPRVRMMTVRWHRGHLWAFTSASSAKADQIRRNERFEFVVNLGGESNVSSLRAAGKVRVEHDQFLRAELAATSPSFKEHWPSSEDPDFMLLRLDVETVETERGPDSRPVRYHIGQAEAP